MRAAPSVEIHERLEEQPVELQFDRRGVGVEKERVQRGRIGGDIESQRVRSRRRVPAATQAQGCGEHGGQEPEARGQGSP